MSATGHKLGRIASVLVDSDGRVTEYRLRKGLRGWLWPAVKVTPDQNRHDRRRDRNRGA